MARPVGFHRRDTLLALLWPELDHAHARNALRQAVHTLREALGPNVVQGRGEEELGIDAQSLWCDACELETAQQAGQPERALELYRGELLGGLHVSAVPEFERWLDEEREHLRRRACEAAQLLVDRDEAAGNPTGAARWARRLTELSPSDEIAARRLIDLLHRSGDRSGAVRAYGDFERRLARDLELEPSSGTRTLVQAVRARQQQDTAPAVAPIAATTPRESPSGAEVVGEDQAGVPTSRPGGGARQRVAVLLALTVTVFAGGGWYLLGADGTETGREPKRLVVLPFANLGAAEDAYFAAGVTEELTARLTAVDRLRVIGSTSANRYKNTNKAIPEIGKELGVDYILEGSIRWQKSGKGPPRVRVTPQLVSTRDGMHLWAQVYDAPLDEIFQVQSDIADRVVKALDLTFREPTQRASAIAPTSNMAAYDYYLRGIDYVRRGAEQTTVRAAAQMYEKAVELDPRFALAHARLSRVHSRMYRSYFDFSPERLARARAAADRALELQPGLAEAHHALAAYYMARMEWDRALQELGTGDVARPSDENGFLARATARLRNGQIKESLVDYEKAWQSDPASSVVASSYGIAYDILRQYPQAEVMYDRSIALAPDRANPYMLKIWLYLRWDGNTRRARATLAQARTAGVADEPTVFYPRVKMEIYDRRFEEAIKLLSSYAREVVSSTQDRLVPRAQLYAEVYELMGRRDQARAYHDSARIFLSREIQARPDDPRLRSALGIAYAGLGRRQEAIKEGLKAVDLIPIEKESFKGYHHAWDLTRIYIAVGEYDTAIPRLEYLLSIPGQLTTAWLRMDPVFYALRGHPRFQRLVPDR
jgi:serine/threonine-protein kinase